MNAVRAITIAVVALALGGSAGLADSLVSFPRINPRTNVGLTGSAGTDVDVPITVDSAAGVNALDLVFTYDPAVIQPTGVYRTAATNDWSLTADLATAGTVDIALTGGTPLAGTANVVWVVFRVVGATSQLSELTWVQARLNGGSIPSTMRDGRVNVVTASVEFDISDTVSAAPAAVLKVPITVTQVTAADSFDLVLTFNQLVIRPLAVEKAPLAAPLSLSSNIAIPGQVNIVLYGASSITGSGELVRIQFEVVGPIGAQTPLDLVRADIAEGAVSTVMDDGLFTVCSGSDGDGDAVTGCAGDCNDANANVYPGAADAVCDGTDNDCDGVADDAYVPQATACGSGACASAGATACVAGVETDDCVPGAPEAELCDLVDNDCDGTIDNPPPPSGPPAVTAGRTGTAIDLSWSSIVASTGYDIVRGGLFSLGATADFSVATSGCVADDLAATTVSDATAAPAGDGLWYLVRAVNCGGAGSYDGPGAGQQGSRDAGIDASPASCP